MKMKKVEISEADKTKALNKVVNLCHANLFTRDGEQVLHYLTEVRGLSEQTIRKFKLGLFPEYPEVAANAAGVRNALKCGIASIKDDGKIVSKFSIHKIIIPILNSDGGVTAIMGRSMLTSDELEELGLPKYTNSHYKKTKNLFGLHYAKDYIRESNKIFIVEGNLDVIVAWQNGMKNVVASCSANFSKYQLILAARYARHICLMFDSDEAGRLGTTRAFKRYKDISAAKLYGASLPIGPKDIDEYFTLGYSKNSKLIYSRSEDVLAAI